MMNELVHHDQFPFALKARMRWSKNVLEERSAPPQILMGSNDPDFCVLLNLGLFLEQMYPVDVNSNGQLNCFSAISKSATNSKTRASRIMKREIFAHAAFRDIRDVQEELGSHSLRKGAATYARRNGCSRDDINVRGRWKRAKLQVDTYLDPDIPYPDAKVAASLCVGGAIKYELLQDSKLDDCWVVENVVPNIYKTHEDKKVAAVLGKALLWACFDGAFQDMVPNDLRGRVHTQYERIRTLSSGVNPVKKVPVVVCGHEGQLFIDKLLDTGAAAVSSDLPVSHDAVQFSSDPTNIYRRRVRHSAEM